MKLSQYTIVEEVDNEILLYNSVYSAIVLLTQSEFHDLQTFINNDNFEKTELFSYLENQNIIVSDEIDGFESIPRTRFVRIFSRFQRVSISSFRPAVKPKPFDRWSKRWSWSPVEISQKKCRW